MAKRQGLTVKNQQGLADVLGINRRTLAEYRSHGCPLVKQDSEYLIAPTAFWFLRREFRKTLREAMNCGAIPQPFHVALDTILTDHEKMQPGFLKSEYGVKPQ